MTYLSSDDTGAVTLSDNTDGEHLANNDDTNDDYTTDASDVTKATDIYKIDVILLGLIR